MEEKFKIRKAGLGWSVSKSSVAGMILPTWENAIAVACKLAEWGY